MGEDAHPEILVSTAWATEHLSATHVGIVAWNNL
jgi:hypothetical protein